MKRLFFIASLIVICFASCDSKPQRSSSLYGFASFADEEEEMVYICTGPYSKKYHKTEDCQWLGSCSEEIEEVTLEEAEEMGKTPCKGCY